MNNAIHIAFVSDAIYPYNKGGKEKRIFDISTRLAQKGCVVDIYTMKWWPNDSNHHTENGVNLHAICSYTPLYSHGRRSIIEAVKFGLSCFKLLKSNFDVVEVDHMPYFPALTMAIVCAIRRKKMVITWLEVWDKKYWKSYLGMAGSIGALFEKITINLPFNILSISGHTTKKINDQYHITNKVTTIQIGIDIQKINTTKPSPHKYDLMFSGRLLTHKHVDYLIHCVSLLQKEFPDINCLIVGQGPQKSQLVQLATNLNLQHKISFKDFYSNATDLYSQIKSTKVFVIPSTREGFSISTIEANACGVPVVVIDHPDNAAKDLVQIAKNGYVCKLDAKDMSQKIATILKSKSMSVSSKKIASKYDWPNIIPSTLDFYKNQI